MVDWASHLLKINCVSKSSEVIFDLLNFLPATIWFREWKGKNLLYFKQKKKKNLLYYVIRSYINLANWYS